MTLKIGFLVNKRSHKSNFRKITLKYFILPFLNLKKTLKYSLTKALFNFYYHHSLFSKNSLKVMKTKIGGYIHVGIDIFLLENIFVDDIIRKYISSQFSSTCIWLCVYFSFRLNVILSYICSHIFCCYFI